MNTPTARTIQTTFADPGAYGTALSLALFSAYGAAPIGGDDAPDGWSPETIHQQIAEDFRVELTPAVFGKLMAAMAILREPGRFYSRVTDFLDLANALNGDSYDPATVDPVDALEASWAIYEALLIEKMFFDESDHRDDRTMEFSPEIRGYLGMMLDREGIVNPPDVLRLAEHDPDRMARVMGDFTDDPDMFSAISTAEDAKTARITTELKLKLQQLLTQIARLFDTDVPTLIRKYGLGTLD